MGKIIDPLLFTEHFGIDPKRLTQLGVMNPLLNVDTKLFIDPLLFLKSSHSEIKVGAANSYKEYFKKIIKLLVVSTVDGDLPWRNAERHFTFHEVKGTCLGYGASTINGSGWGHGLQQKTLRTAKEIISLGIDDPLFFMVLALFEEGVGPDRISDMVTNIILKDLSNFNQRIVINLGLQPDNFLINNIQCTFLKNPLESRKTPIILIPLDILRELPIANDWQTVCDAARENENFRQQINQQVGEIWQAKTRQEKNNLKRALLADKNAFQSFLDLIKSTNVQSYDFSLDSAGEIFWTHMLKKDFLPTTYPLKLKLAESPSLSDVYFVVKQIVEHFQILIEEKGLWKELWTGEKNRPEKSVQRLFFAIADAYCKANNLDMSPEADSGSGPVDFKFSKGYVDRVLVEIKLSNSRKLVQGYEKQLEAYKAAEETTRAIYLIIDIGKMNDKDQKVMVIKNKAAVNGLAVSEVIIINGNKQLSGSKR